MLCFHIQLKINRRCARGLTALLLISAIISLAANPQDTLNSNEPKGNHAEAELLEQAAEMAETAPLKAVKMLEPHTDPEISPAIDFALAIYAVQSDNLALAEESLRTALDKLPVFHRARLQLARILIQNEEYKPAAAELRQLLYTDFPEKTELWLLLALTYTAEDHYTAAETAARQALIHDPDNRDAKLGIIRALANQGRIEAAESLIAELMAQQPGEKQLWHALAQASLKNDNPLEAMVLLECMRRLEFADLSALTTLGDLYLARQIPHLAIDLYQEILPLHNAPLERIIAAAQALLEMQEIEEARKLIRALEKDHGRLTGEQVAKLKILRARLFWNTGAAERAALVYQKVLEADPLHGEALLRLGEIHLREESFSDAELFFQRATRLDDYRPQALVGLARIQLQQGQYGQAIALLEESLAAEDNPQVKDFLDQIKRIAEL